MSPPVDPGSRSASSQAEGLAPVAALADPSGVGTLGRFLRTMSTAHETARSVPSDGTFTTLPFTTIVVDPPPSTFMAFAAPRWRISPASSTSDMPTDVRRLPSTVTSRTRPPRVTPMAVRGFL